MRQASRHRTSEPRDAVYVVGDAAVRLPHAEVLALIARAQAGDVEARKTAVMANMRLVIAHARRKLHIAGTLDLWDLVAEGALGLGIAVDRFDLGRGIQFSTYATYWVRQSIQHAINRASVTIRIPQNVRDRIRVSLNEGRDPEFTPGTLTNCYDPGEAGGFGGFDVAARDLTPPMAAIRAEELARLEELITTLPARSAAIIRLRHGLGGNDPLTLEEVGVRFSITRERVRQVQIDAEAILVARASRPRRAAYPPGPSPFGPPPAKPEPEEGHAGDSSRPNRPPPRLGQSDPVGGDPGADPPGQGGRPRRPKCRRPVEHEAGDRQGGVLP